MRIAISKSEFHELGGDDNELLAKVWTDRGWVFFRSFDGQ